MRSSGASSWVGAAFGSAVASAAVSVAVFGAGRRGIDCGLLVTARIGFLFFWASYVGGALVVVFGPVFEPLRRRARSFGLAFTSVLSVHLGLVAWLCAIGDAPSARTFVFFGVGVVCAVALIALSVDAVRRTLGPGTRWLVRVVGLNYLAYAFAVDFINAPLSGGAAQIVEYLPFAILSVAGPGLRVLAFGRGPGVANRTRRAGRPASLV